MRRSIWGRRNLEGVGTSGRGGTVRPASGRSMLGRGASGARAIFWWRSNKSYLNAIDCKITLMRTFRFLTLAFVIATILKTTATDAQVRLPQLIADDMVLQRDMPITVWG